MLPLQAMTLIISIRSFQSSGVLRTMFILAVMKGEEDIVNS